ncbi:hypothetical protein HJG60_011832 [Phyllostomus discolor]|uniref:Uncharacterized protein n=1 Tax=Phyllostomus discolor TaxID=89673 RepID=A0A833ZJ14_9CHIR|nr:hypothetical protein HJG60_011832 [Phyllostomus discolor]
MEVGKGKIRTTKIAERLHFLLGEKAIPAIPEEIQSQPVHLPTSPSQRVSWQVLSLQHAWKTAVPAGASAAFPKRKLGQQIQPGRMETSQLATSFHGPECLCIIANPLPGSPQPSLLSWATWSCRGKASVLQKALSASPSGRKCMCSLFPMVFLVCFNGHTRMDDTSA